MLSSALLEARSGTAPIALTLSEQAAANPAFAPVASLFDRLEVANDNPRTLEEELGTRLVTAQRELSLVSMYLTEEFRAGTMRQLSNLLDPKSWDDDDALLDVLSGRTFARSMAVLRPKIRPMLGLSPKGNLLAMWASDAARLSFEFLAGDELKWFIHSKAPKDRDSALGTTMIGRLRRILDAHDLSALLYGEG